MKSFLRNPNANSPMTRLMLGFTAAVMCAAVTFGLMRYFDKSGTLFPFERTVMVNSGTFSFTDEGTVHFITDEEGRSYRYASGNALNDRSFKANSIPFGRLHISGYWEFGSDLIPNRVVIGLYRLNDSAEKRDSIGRPHGGLRPPLVENADLEQGVDG